MKMSLYKRVLFCLLAIVICLGCTACKTADVKTTEEEELIPTLTTEENQTFIPAPETIVEEEFVDELPDGELLGKIGAWRGYAETGTLAERDQYSLTTIESKKDLDVCREALSNFTEEDEKMILNDKGGKCVLVELTGPEEKSLFGTSSIMQAGSTISIIISMDEADEPLPRHTFFLLYFPEQYYNGEVIQLDF